MSITISFEEPSRFLLEGSGRITGAESIEALQTVLNDPRLCSGCVILVTTHDVTAAPRSDELRDIAEVARQLMKKGARALLIVTAPGFTYGVARMFAAIAEIVGVRVEVFQDVDVARERLETISAEAA